MCPRKRPEAPARRKNRPICLREIKIHMTAQIGARRTLKLTPEGFRGTKRPHPPHGRVRRRARRPDAVYAPGAPRRVVSGRPARLDRGARILSRERRPRERRGGTTSSAVSTARRSRTAKGVFGDVAENAPNFADEKKSDAWSRFFSYFPRRSLGRCTPNKFNSFPRRAA